MQETHELPDDLNPTGDICYPLFIPDDAQYRHLVLGALSQLTIPEYYREFDFALADVEDVCRVWTDRMLVPFVQAMNDNEECAMTTIFQAVARTSAQAIPANTPTALIWEQGNFDASNPTRKLIQFNGHGVIVARVQFTSVTTGLKHVAIRRNGAEIMARLQFPTAGAFFSFSLTAADYVVDTDYLELILTSATAATLVFTEFNPTLSIFGRVE